ncbi:hypothetical protein HKD37_13G036858 [Glycine soja]|nr:hypothetical protein GmHk_13G037703 [Glycine max]
MADDEPSSNRLDRLKAAILDLNAAQLHSVVTLNSIVFKLDVILLKLHIPIPSSSSAQSPPPPPPSILTPPPCSAPMQPSHVSLPAPLSMLHAPPCPVPMQQSQAPMPAPHLAANSKHQVPHMLSSVFNQLCHVRVVVSLDNLLGVVVHDGSATAPHDKPLEHRTSINTLRTRCF